VRSVGGEEVGALGERLGIGRLEEGQGGGRIARRPPETAAFDVGPRARGELSRLVQKPISLLAAAAKAFDARELGQDVRAAR